MGIMVLCVLVFDLVEDFQDLLNIRKTRRRLHQTCVELAPTMFLYGQLNSWIQGAVLILGVVTARAVRRDVVFAGSAGYMGILVTHPGLEVDFELGFHACRF